FYIKNGRMDEALTAMRQAVVETERATGKNEFLTRNAAVARHNLASVLIQAGQPAEALTYLDKNSDYFEHHGSKNDRARPLGLRGHCLRALGRTAEATELMQQAAVLFAESGSPALADSMRSLARKSGTP